MLLDNYMCQITLPDFGEAGQKRLFESKVLVIGAGGLGCPALLYLASSGIGEIGIMDGDNVSSTNLHRQILYSEKNIGENKALCASSFLNERYTTIKINTYNFHLNQTNAINIISNYDIILDCTDNFESRYLINDACVLCNKPLIYGAIYQYEGQLAAWNIPITNGERSTNYRHLYPEVNASQIPNCNAGGVLPTLAGIIGTMQTNEAIKYLSGCAPVMANEVLLFDCITLRSTSIKIPNNSTIKITALPQPSEVQEIAIEDYYEHATEYILIDVRTPEEHIEQNIGGKNIPLDSIYLTEITDFGKKTICYCASGYRSKQAVLLLQLKFPELEFYVLKQ